MGLRAGAGGGAEDREGRGTGAEPATRQRHSVIPSVQRYHGKIDCLETDAPARSSESVLVMTVGPLPRIECPSVRNERLAFY